MSSSLHGNEIRFGMNGVMYDYDLTKKTMTHVAGSLASLQHKHNKQRNIQFRSANVSNQLQRNNNNNLL